MIRANNVHTLLDSGESETLEFKIRIENASQLAKIIGAFANSKGGIILIGVNEASEIVGTDVRKIEQLYDKTIKKLNPRPTTSFSSLKIDGKHIAIVEVKESQALIFADNGTYIRRETITQTMSPNEISNSLASSPTQQANQLDSISRSIAKQTNQIEKLEDELQESQSWSNKILDYVIGGIIGSIFGFILSHIV